MSYNRFLFIGLGGSGGATLGHLRNNIKKWLVENGQPSDIPEGWQFLHIDTPDNADVGTELELPANEYIGLIPDGGISFSAVQGALENQVLLHPDMATWRVDPVAYPYPLGAGAGQYRAIGATVAMHYLDKIKRGINGAYQRLESGGARSGLSTLYTAVTGKATDTTSPIRVVLVSSLAGGSGAGMLMTVADTLRAIDNEGCKDIFGVLYTPDVFGGGGNISGTTPNSLAAISEILNGYWWGGSINRAEENPPAKNLGVLASNGLPAALEASGPRFPFLVGRTNARSVDHGSPSNLFSIVGRSLLSWTTDTAVQEEFIAYTIGNWKTASTGHEQSSKTLLTGGTDAEIGYPAISSLGFSRLSLGTEYFEEYASKRIAREVTDFALWNHVNGHEGRKKGEVLGIVDGDEIASAVAADHLKGWLDRCRLDELGQLQNQIQESLLPDDKADIYRSFIDLTKSLSGIGGAESLKSDEWLDRLGSALKTSQVAYNEDYLRGLDQKGHEWVDNIQEAICRETKQAISNWGLKITSALLAHAGSEMVRVAKELREVDTLNYGNWAEAWKDTFRGALDGVSGKMPGDNAQLNEALRLSLNYCQYQGEKMGAERASELTLELVDRLILPMKSAIDEAFEAAEATWDAKVSGWPSWTATSITKELRPPKSERTLIDPKDWPGLFDAMLAESFPSELPGELRTTLRETVSQGSFEPAPEGPSQCIEIASNWMPSLPVFSGNPAYMELSINFSSKPIKSRAQQWMKRSASPFGNLLNTSLRSYLGEEGVFDDQVSPAEIGRRQTNFLAELSAVIDAADPLVDIDTDLLAQVHTATTATARYFSRIPLDAHELTDRVVTLLDAAGVDAGVVSTIMVSGNKLKGIDVTTTLGAPHNLLTIKSLMEPISEQWATANAGGNNSFWKMRRSKPLREFIPAPQALIHCLIRGWYTARLLGKIDTKAQPVEIFCADRAPAQFPKNELSPNFAGPADMMARILESLAIAYVECSRDKSLEPLRAYTELRDLGSSFPGTTNASLYQYETLNPELKNWIDTGEVETDKGWAVSPVVKTEMSGSGKEAAIARAAALGGVLEKELLQTNDAYNAMVTESNQFPNTLTHTKLWRGLSGALMTEFAKLRATVGVYEISLKSDEGQNGGGLMGGE